MPEPNLGFGESNAKSQCNVLCVSCGDEELRNHLIIAET